MKFDLIFNFTLFQLFQTTPNLATYFEVERPILVPLITPKFNKKE
jgi:hypothetical protein